MVDRCTSGASVVVDMLSVGSRVLGIEQLFVLVDTPTASFVDRGGLVSHIEPPVFRNVDTA